MWYFPRFSDQSYFRKSNENEIDVLAFLVFQICKSLRCETSSVGDGALEICCDYFESVQVY